jgi:hypothetical protein
MTLAASVARLLAPAPTGAAPTSVCVIDGTCSRPTTKEN